MSFQLFPIAKETGFTASFIAAKRHISLHLASNAATSSFLSEKIWKYTLPCIQWACATFPACNWHGGYDLMFLTIRLNRTLEMMQNDVETSEFEYRSMEI